MRMYVYNISTGWWACPCLGQFQTHYGTVENAIIDLLFIIFNILLFFSIQFLNSSQEFLEGLHACTKL